MAGIDQAVAILRDGGLVAFPTETVYGLGADASNPQAVAKIFAAKGRPVDHPVIVHVADAAQLAQWAREVPPAVYRLAQQFWPGPLTLILRRAAHVSDFVTGGQDSVGLRVPAHPLALQLLKAFGGGIAAPSANRFGRISPTTAQHVRDELGNSVDMVLDGGACQVGIESTIVDLSGDAPALLRPGKISAAELETVLGMPLAAPQKYSPRVSGSLASHYAPHTPMRLLATDALLVEAQRRLMQGQRVAVLLLSRSAVLHGATLVHAPDDALAYAHDLYANLRSLDAARCDILLVEVPPQTQEWLAVNDRLKRAAADRCGEEET
ncbi:MAG: L-threonylcarbamoyladenylate synthase [Pseudomonadota bacterium]